MFVKCKSKGQSPVAERSQQEALQRQVVEPLAAPPAPLYLPLRKQYRNTTSIRNRSQVRVKWEV